MADKPYRGTGPADRAIREGMTQALELIGSDLTGKAQRLAPKREGTLRASGRWEVDGATSFAAGGRGAMSASIGVTVTFDVPYAAVQHENTSYAHTNGQAKYLEQPLKSNALIYRKVIERNVSERLRRRLGS